MLPLIQQEFYPLYCCTVSLYKNKKKVNRIMHKQLDSVLLTQD